MTLRCVRSPERLTRPAPLSRCKLAARVSPLGVRIAPAHFYQSRVVDVRTEYCISRDEVRLQAVRRELHAIREARSQILHERIRGLRIAATDVPRDHKL